MNTPNLNPIFQHPSVEITPVKQISDQNDPPLIDLKITNPLTYLKRWLSRILRNEGIILKLTIKPLTAIFMVLAFTTVGGAGFSVAEVFFPNSSPIFHRSVVHQGIIEKTPTGSYVLSKVDGSSSLFTLKNPSSVTQNLLEQRLNQAVIVKGNLGREPNVIDIKEVL